MTNISIEFASDSALIVYLPGDLCSNNTQCLNWLSKVLLTEFPEQIVEVVPSYQSLLVQFNPFHIDYFALKKQITYLYESFLKQDNSEVKAGKLVELPVYYDLSVGPDIELIAKNNGLTTDEVIRLHQQTEYSVFAIGFAPGFAYLGQVDKKIASPRLATPRKKVPKGAVAIADRQTAVYPAQSPGGWNIVGLCPVDLFDATKDPVMPFAVGDVVKFVCIDKNEFLALGGQL